MKINSPKLRPVLFGDKYFILDEDYNIQIGKLNIVIPKGFVTDLASVPRIFTPIIERYGKHTSASLVHDYLYSKYNDLGINRTLADKIFLYIMKESGVGLIKRNIMYSAVRMFGELNWETKLKNEGYKDKAFVDYTDEAKQYYDDMKKVLGEL